MHVLGLNYILFSICLIILLFSNEFKLQNNKGYLAFVAISFVVLAILHVFVDIESVEDLSGYKSGYNTIAHTSWSNIFDVFRKGDKLYSIINKACNYISEDFRFFLLVYNIFLLCSHYFVLSKYSPSLPISIVVFLACTYNQSLFVLRQYLAISLLFVSIPFLINRKLIPYTLLCISAFYVHSSALLFFPLYFIYGLRSKLLLTFTVVLAILFSSSLNSDIGMYLLLLNIDYEEYVDFYANHNLTVTLIPVSYLIAYILVLKKHIMDDGINRLCLIALIFYAIGYAFAPSVDLIGRILKYYEIFIFFAVPITLYYMKSFLLRFLYLFFVLVLQGYLSIRNLSEFYFSDYKLDTINFLYLLIILVTDLILVVLINKFQNKQELVKINKIKERIFH